MNRKLAELVAKLMNEKLNLPEIFLDLITENLVKGDFDRVLEFYNKRLSEKVDKTSEHKDNRHITFISDVLCYLMKYGYDTKKLGKEKIDLIFNSLILKQVIEENGDIDKSIDKLLKSAEKLLPKLEKGINNVKD